MKLECVKYKEKMSPEGAFCKHPGDYCKYRTSCIIHFMGSQNKSVVAADTGNGSPEKTKDGNKTDDKA